MVEVKKEMTKLELMAFFQKNVIQFLDCLIELLPNEGDLIILRVMFENQIPVEQSMNIFSSRIIPYKMMVESRDERFFIECTDLFAGVKKEKVSYFKDLWQSNTLTNDDKNALWKWFQLFLKLALKYEKYMK
jgi:hypothetical protein